MRHVPVMLRCEFPRRIKNTPRLSHDCRGVRSQGLAASPMRQSYHSTISHQDLPCLTPAHGGVSPCARYCIGLEYVPVLRGGAPGVTHRGKRGAKAGPRDTSHRTEPRQPAETVDLRRAQNVTARSKRLAQSRPDSSGYGALRSLFGLKAIFLRAFS